MTIGQRSNGAGIFTKPVERRIFSNKLSRKFKAYLKKTTNKQQKTKQKEIPNYSTPNLHLQPPRKIPQYPKPPPSTAMKDTTVRTKNK